VFKRLGQREQFCLGHGFTSICSGVKICSIPFGSFTPAL